MSETQRPFNPYERLEKIGNKPYLNPRNAITWFYAENPRPHGRILTSIVQFDPLIVRAEVWIDNVCIATGHAAIDERSTGKGLKAFETAAIRRALANAGYGTEQALWWNAQQQIVAKQKQQAQNERRRIEGESKSNPEAPASQLVEKVTNVATGEIVQPAPTVMATENGGPMASQGQTDLREETARQQPDLRDGGPMATTDPASAADAAFDSIRTGEPEASVETPMKLHPKNMRVWDLGKVKTYTIVEKKYIDSKGATPHFDNLIQKLEASLRITDTSSTEDVCRIIDEHYTAKAPKERRVS